MRLHRARRKAGLSIALVELRATEIDYLRRLGYLEDGGSTGRALGAAIGELLDRLPAPERWPRVD